MTIDPEVRRLVHNVLYRAACGHGRKARAAEAELRARGDHARADIASLQRALFIEELVARSAYWSIRASARSTPFIFDTTTA